MLSLLACLPLVIAQDDEPIPPTPYDRVYELEITATDGTTPEVADRSEFLYQGETVVRFLSP